MPKTIYFERTETILKMLQEEKIDSSPLEAKTRINGVRKATSLLSSDMLAPGLTASVATTLLGVGLCHELSQRFVLEYLLKYQDQAINLIFLFNRLNFTNPKAGSLENHVLVQLGPVKAPDALFVGRGSSEITINEQNSQTLRDFLEANKGSTFADPLINFAGIFGEEDARFLQYCQENNITHVVGVRSFHHVQNLIQNAPLIKKNAVEISNTLRPLLAGLTKKSAEHKEAKHLPPIPVAPDLPSTTPVTSEKWVAELRKSAAGQVVTTGVTPTEKLKSLLEEGKKAFPNFKELIQKAGTAKGRNALHWAAAFGDINKIKALLEAGADPRIPDGTAEKQTAYDIAMALPLVATNPHQPKRPAGEVLELLKIPDVKEMKHLPPIPVAVALPSTAPVTSEKWVAELRKSAAGQVITVGVTPTEKLKSLLEEGKKAFPNFAELIQKPGMAKGRNALHWAAASGASGVPRIKALLEAGADPKIPDGTAEKQTAYDIAIALPLVVTDPHHPKRPVDEILELLKIPGTIASVDLDNRGPTEGFGPGNF